jgi:predicted nicotinamide N-methyase
LLQQAVWDSAIVLAKYLERWPKKVVGKRCIELGSGCGLAGITAACLGAEKVFLTNFIENLPLLEQNCVANRIMEVSTTMPLVWGREVVSEIGDIDVILATDIMYYDDAVKPLLATLHALSGHNPLILFAYGRNQQAEETFMRALERSNFCMKRIKEEELDDVYQCVDVDVFEIGLMGHH